MRVMRLSEHPLAGQSRNQMISAPDTEAVNAIATGGAVVVDRSVIEEALEQIEANPTYSAGDCNDQHCAGCGAWLYYNAETKTYVDGDAGYGEEHKGGCRYVRVRDALRKALGR